VLEKPNVEVIEKLETLEDLGPILKRNAGKDLLLVVEQIEPEALNALIVAKTKGLLNVVAVKSPGFGDSRQEILKDLAAVSGSAEKIIITADKTTLIHSGDASDRIAEITEQIKIADNYAKPNLEKRRASLQGKVAVIKVGGATETEIEEKKFRVDDSVFAAKAALDGVVPGGATTLLDLAAELPEDSLLKKALEQPFSVLLSNVGLNASDFKAGGGRGLDVSSPDAKLIDLKEAGILEPAKTVREAIKNAVSIAGTAITMTALIVPEEKEDE
jgi:chaperonin GroEL